MGHVVGHQVGHRVGHVVGHVSTRLQQLEAYLANNLFSWARADYYSEALGNVTALLDKVADGVGARAIDPSHSYAQGTSASQGTIVNPAEIGDLPAVRFTGANSVKYVSTLSAASWNFIHNGSGARSVLVFIPRLLNVSQFYMSTEGGGGAQGAGVFTQTNSNVGQVVRNSSGTILLLFSGAGELVLDQASLVEAKYAEGASPEGTVRHNGAQVASGNTTAAPTASDATHTLWIGGHSAFGQYPTMDFADMLVTQSDADVAAIREYVALRYGRPSWNT